MAQVPCPVCGPAHEVRRFHDEIKEFRSKLLAFTKRHPDNSFGFKQLELVNRMNSFLETTLKQRVAAQRAVKGACPVCHGVRSVDTNVWGEEAPHGPR